MADFMDEDADLDAALFVLYYATTFLNFYAEISECCTKRKHRVRWICVGLLVSSKHVGSSA